MRIKELKIKNIGIFDDNSTAFQLGGKVATLIGENGTGKSTILFLLNFILNYKLRKNGIQENWINEKARLAKENAEVEFTFDVKGVNFLDSMVISENDEVYIHMILSFNENEGKYESKFYVGKTEEFEYSETEKLPFDDFISIIFIDSSLKNEENTWISSHINNSESKIQTIDKINENMQQVNDNIAQIQEIDYLNKLSNEKINNIFPNNNFNVQVMSNVEFGTINKTLKFQSILKNSPIITHGAGFKKIFSIIALIESKLLEEKKIILICDELENNLFYTYQKNIIDNLQKHENLIQIIIATHSPNIVSLNNNSSILKLQGKTQKSFLINETTNYYYHQIDLAKSVFYEYILMVEGHAEKMFFEFLFNNNKTIKEKIKNKSISIINIQGIHFQDKVKLLKSLTKQIFILTDNDYWSGTAQGLKRINKILNLYLENEDYSKKLKNFKISKDNKDDFINKNIQELKDKAEKNHIHTQDKIGQTFEDSLLDEKLIKDKETQKKISNSKLKLLSKYIEEINNKVDDKVIKDSPYLFKWLRSFDE